MLSYVIRRILATIPVMAGVALFVFCLLYIALGDPAAFIAGDQATPADVERIRQNRGLDQPFMVRFGLLRHVTELTAQQESNETKPWVPSDAPAPYVEAMLRGIVGFRFCHYADRSQVEDEPKSRDARSKWGRERPQQAT